MYRRSLEMEGNNIANEEACNFLSRVASLPMVHSVMISTMGVYNKAKESNGLVNYTLVTAEKTVLVAAEHAKPVMVKLETPIVLANNLACKTLDKLEETVPIIKRTPEEIAAETKKLYDETIVQPALVKYNNAKAYGVQKVVAVKDYSLAKATLLMDTKYGHMLAVTLDEMLMKADGYMDSYLPPTNLCGQPDEPTMDKDGNTVAKVAVFSKKVHQRMLCHTLIKLQAAKKRSDEILANLHITVDLIQMAKSNLDHTNKAVMDRLNKASAKIVQLWEEFNKGNPNEPGEKTLEQKLLFVAGQLTNQLHNTYKKMASTLAFLPSSVQPTVALVQEYVKNLYTQFSQAKSWDDVSGVIVLRMKDAINNLQILSTNIYDQILKVYPISRLVKANQDERKAIYNGSVGCNSADVSCLSSAAPENECTLGNEQQTNAITDNSATVQNYSYKHDPPSNSNISH